MDSAQKPAPSIYSPNRTNRMKAAKPRFADATEKLCAYWLAPSSRGVVLQYEFRCPLYKRTLKLNLFQN